MKALSPTPILVLHPLQLSESAYLWTEMRKASVRCVMRNNNSMLFGCQEPSHREPKFARPLPRWTNYPSCTNRTPHSASWRNCEHKCGGISPTSPNTPNKVGKRRRYVVCAVRCLFVLPPLFAEQSRSEELYKQHFCSSLFGVVRSAFVLKSHLKVRKCAENRTCSFCSAKKQDTL